MVSPLSVTSTRHIAIQAVCWPRYAKIIKANELHNRWVLFWYILMYFAMSNDLWLPKHARATISYHCHYYHLIFDAFQAAFREDPPIPRPQADGRNGLHDPLENAGESGTSCHHNVQPYATHNSDIRGQFFDLPLFFSGAAARSLGLATLPASANCDSDTSRGAKG